MVFWRLGSATKIAAHYAVPRQVAVHWINVLRKEGAAPNPGSGPGNPTRAVRNRTLRLPLLWRDVLTAPIGERRCPLLVASRLGSGAAGAGTPRSPVATRPPRGPQRDVEPAQRRLLSHRPVPFHADNAALARSAEHFGVLWTPMSYFYPRGRRRTRDPAVHELLSDAGIEEGTAGLARFVEAEIEA